MLFFFRGPNGPVVRTIVGAILLAIGIVIHGGALLAGVGAVLLIWGAIGALSSYRVRRQEAAGHGSAAR
jgi:hypothetical protein